ncbi:MFS transporter [Streptomyces sp. TRM64462]|uniref:MFS transporter n=1 Tax=Streptomyces sp. TRM64462 TaxID=2741726 RepID=UPI001C2F7854|nr:MFS transporter [Streptomyces sp. TRM64462]
MSTAGDEVAGAADAARGAAPPRRRSLWLHRGFTALWSAHTLSQFGTQIAFFALPVLAVTTLGASTTELGLLAAAETLPFLLIGLPAGVLVDRWPRRPVLIVADLVRAVLLAAVPLAHLAGVLTFPLLFAVAMLVGTATVLFDIAYLSYLPDLVDHADLPAGNARLEFSRSAAESAGPGLGGLAVQWTSAATAVWGNVLSYLGSALLLGLIGRGSAHGEAPADAHGDTHAETPAETPADKTGAGGSMAGAIRDGLRFVFRHPVLRALAVSTAVANLFGIGGALSAVLTAYAVNDLRLSVGLFGLALTVGNAGAVAGALLNGVLLRVLGPGRTLILTSLLPPLGLLLLATAAPARAAVVIAAAMGLIAGSVTVYNINQVSLRQAVTPAGMQGRMNASMRFAIWGALPLGALAGGALADLIGIRATLWCLGALGCTACLPLLIRPVRTLRRMPSL